MQLRVRGLFDQELQREFRTWADGLIGTIASPSLVRSAIDHWSASHGLPIKEYVTYAVGGTTVIDVLFGRQLACPKCRKANDINDDDYVCFACREAMPS